MSARLSVKEAQRLGLLPSDKLGGKAKSPRAVAPPRPKTKRHRRPVSGLPDPAVEVRFFVPGDPVPKARARTHMPREAVASAFRQAGGDNSSFEALMKGVKHRTFTPAATAKYERLVKQFAAAAMRSRPPIDVPVEVVIAGVFEGDPATWPTDHSDPDVDNVEKAIMDALKGVVWTDDRLVVRCVKVKACGPLAGAYVTVREAAPYDPVRDGWFKA